MTRARVAVWMVAMMGCVEAPREVNPTTEGGTPDVRHPRDAETNRTDSGCDAWGYCAADFPCGGRRFVCLGAAGWRRVSSRHCSFRCGCTPCIGQSCEVEGAEMQCPEGTVCTLPDLQGGMIDSRTTPCAPPAPVEDIAVRTARVRALLVGTWIGYQSYPSGGDTFFTIALREDGGVVLGCIYRDRPCTPFGFATPGTAEGQTWTLDEVDSTPRGRGSLRLATAAGPLHTLILEDMLFRPSTEAITHFFASLPRNDAGVPVQYVFERR